jgi:hypothetical protein
MNTTRTTEPEHCVSCDDWAYTTHNGEPHCNDCAAFLLREAAAFVRGEIARNATEPRTDRAVAALSTLVDIDIPGSSFDLDDIVSVAVDVEECRWWRAVQFKIDNGDAVAAALDSVADTANRQILADARNATSGPSGGAHRLFDMGVKTEGAARFADHAAGLITFLATGE